MTLRSLLLNGMLMEQNKGTSSTLTITGNVTTALNWYQQGAHTITLVATTPAPNSKTYSGTWNITCNP